MVLLYVFASYNAILRNDNVRNNEYATFAFLNLLVIVFIEYLLSIFYLEYGSKCFEFSWKGVKDNRFQPKGFRIELLIQQKSP